MCSYKIFPSIGIVWWNVGLFFYGNIHILMWSTEGNLIGVTSNAGNYIILYPSITVLYADNVNGYRMLFTPVLLLPRKFCTWHTFYNKFAFCQDRL